MHLRTLPLAGLALLTFPLAAQHHEPAKPAKPAAPTQDLVGVAKAVGTFSTLLQAAQAAGLVDALRADGPLTLFAPTDAAFAKLPKADLAALLQPANRDKLAAILKHHVVAGRWPAAKVIAQKELSSLNGTPLPVSAGDEVRVGGALVVQPDIAASNGLVHVIDSVILPPAATPDLVDAAVAAGSFRTLVAAVQAAGLEEALRGKGPFTVFAPTDEAFAKLDPKLLKSLLQPENKAKLTAILTYHVVPGRVLARDAVTAGAAETLQGGKVRISIADGRLQVQDANLVKTDLEVRNGVIHVIDRVILPQ